MYHVYIGTEYQGCIQAKNPTHAMSEWAKIHRLGQIILRVEESTTAPPEKVVNPKNNRERKHANRHPTSGQ